VVWGNPFFGELLKRNPGDAGVSFWCPRANFCGESKAAEELGGEKPRRGG